MTDQSDLPETPRDSNPAVTFDRTRAARIGLEEAVLAEFKTPEQVTAIVQDAVAEERRLLLTRLHDHHLEALPGPLRDRLDHCPLSRTGVVGDMQAEPGAHRIGLVSAGTSDSRPLAEARRVLAYAGVEAEVIQDVGVAGLWRLLRREEELKRMSVVIVFAGMDAALPSVVGGMVPGLVIAVPTSVGYGVAEGGQVALNACLASCAPGVVVVNIDNGYGAATAALRFVNMLECGGR